MMMKVSTTNLPKVLLIKLDLFEDFRGNYVGLYNEKLYREMGVDIKFVEEDVSVSTKNVLRGIHSDSQAWKLVTRLYGKIYLVIVNCDPDCGGFGKWQSFVLSETNDLQILAPHRYGVAHLVLSDKAIFRYKQLEYYEPSRQSTYRCDDPRFNIWWPVKNPILSQRDEVGHYV
jgi:dTDP-4-dehydrorhamnose 3,5-epimerase